MLTSLLLPAKRGSTDVSPPSDPHAERCGKSLSVLGKCVRFADIVLRTHGFVLPFFIFPDSFLVLNVMSTPAPMPESHPSQCARGSVDVSPSVRFHALGYVLLWGLDIGARWDRCLRSEAAFLFLLSILLLLFYPPPSEAPLPPSDSESPLALAHARLAPSDASPGEHRHGSCVRYVSPPIPAFTRSSTMCDLLEESMRSLTLGKKC
ncbi:hypothetical protein NLJ89_g3584 [Agrocybe chaxingu]|uniref:Uncharacterized protein n=1 Tax=Agrocybe chaxingu TaxID=84603 RepID=A0A9W8K4Z6_9AGAR|nr:hypothetical protein NLJ89_g3584 [Agrocybe chaxingu]